MPYGSFPKAYWQCNGNVNVMNGECHCQRQCQSQYHPPLIIHIDFIERLLTPLFVPVTSIHKKPFEGIQVMVVTEHVMKFCYEFLHAPCFLQCYKTNHSKSLIARLVVFADIFV